MAKARPSPVSVSDVARYVLDKLGPVSSMKLQKLVYYCQAWSLVWDEAPLFQDEIQAWANGPVIPRLWNRHSGAFTVGPGAITGDPSKMSAVQRHSVDRVLKFYGDKPAQWLIDLTHMEEPWVLARRGLAPTERGNRVITHVSMADYYSRISANANAR